MDCAEQFDEYFAKYKDKQIAIYGLGENARFIFTKTVGYNYSALTAKDHLGDKYWGMTVITVEKAIDCSDLMIIAASPNATNIIYARIKNILPRNYSVYDIRGHRLNGNKSYAINPYWNKTLKDLRQEIKRHDVISFDIFDTLITRRILYPQNIFELIEREICAKGINVPFARYRRAAEHDLLNRGTTPNISDIYKHLEEKYKLSHNTVQTLMTTELNSEMDFIYPRTVMIDCLRYAKKHKKTVVLTSDMYLTSSELKPLLTKCGIDDYNEIFVSCEYKATKSDGLLFECLKSCYSGKSILHIGDNEKSDVEMAQIHHLDAFGVMNAVAMLCSSSAVHIMDKVRNIDDCILLGHILSDVFNDPFALNDSMGKLYIDSFSRLAEFCFLPITMRYMQFIVQTVNRSHNKDTILLFISRDGYLLQKIYRQFSNRYGLPDDVYFYTSRKAAIGAIIKDESDIDVLLSDIERVPVKNLKQFLDLRFQIEFPADFDMSIETAIKTWGKDGLKKRILALKDAIFSASASKKKGYSAYIDKLNLQQYKEIYCIDIITRGTTVYALNRMTNHQIKLIACFGNELPNKYITDISQCFLLLGNVTLTSKLNNMHKFLETIYASDEGQLSMFDENGNKKFASNTQYNQQLLHEIRDTIANFTMHYMDKMWMFRHISDDFAVAMMDLLHESYSDIAAHIVRAFDFYDYLGNESNYNVMAEYRAT